jgi:hypothetical protein
MKLKCAGRPTSRVTIVDRAFDNLYCTNHIDISKGAGSKDKVKS